MDSLLRKIPKVDEVMKHDRWRELLRLHPQETAKNALRAALDDLRLNIKEKKLAAVPAIEHIIEETARRATELSRPGLRRVINGTGVVIHTNLGRSILAKPVIDALMNIASNYSNLEYDLARGKRGLGTGRGRGPLPCDERRADGMGSVAREQRQAAAALAPDPRASPDARGSDCDARQSVGIESDGPPAARRQCVCCRGRRVGRLDAGRLAISVL